MILESPGKHKTLVTVLGHKHPEFMIDNEEAFRFFHPNTDEYVFTFIVDNDKKIADHLRKTYGEEFVYFTGTKNGWGRGCLRSFVGGIEYFEKHHKFNDLITFDADCICTGPFLSQFSRMGKKDKKIFFGGKVWPLAKRDMHMQIYFQKEIGLPYNPNIAKGKWKENVIAGPCMLWTESCLEYMRAHGWLSLESFDSFYEYLYFPHDQISMYMRNYTHCEIISVKDFLVHVSGSSIRYKTHEDFGKVPIIGDARVLHPTGLGEGARNIEENYDLEKNNRAYLKHIRSQYARKSITRDGFVEQDNQAEKIHRGPPPVIVHTKFIKSKNCTGCEEEIDGSEISQDVAKEEKGCNKTTKFI